MLMMVNSIRIPLPYITYRRYLLYKTSYRRFCLIFRCHGNGGWSW